MYGRDVCIHQKFYNVVSWAHDPIMSGVVIPCTRCGEMVISAPFGSYALTWGLQSTNPIFSLVLEADKAPVRCRDPVAWYIDWRWDRGRYYPNGIVPPRWGVCAHRYHHCTTPRTTPTIPAEQPAGGDQLTLI